MHFLTLHWRGAATADRREFQAETRQLLDIVTHSIYTDKEVFIRELISNASDALEKLRHLQSTGATIQDAELEPKIVITTDEKAGTLTIADTGVGMSKDELIENLGTIARSGSKAFLEQLKESSPGETGDALSGIIGKFGVGFYSAFMVADKVEVFSQSAVSGRQSHLWRSDGSGSYEVAEASDVTRGSKIVIHLKDSCKEFGTKAKVESIIRRYSNFVSFPIVLDGDTVNTVQALWTKSESDVTDEEYTEFYKFIANAFDEPAYRIIFKADAPIELKTLFFIGSSHTEKFGYARLEPGVSLYSRKVLIERNSPDILPDWMRFVRGVVDSEDLPLSLSREKMQDSRLIHKIRDVLTRRIIRFLERESTKEPDKFEKFFKEFGQFIKEGICTDFQNKDALAKLLRYESSQVDEGKLTTLDEYVSRCPPDQNEIYYLCAPTRAIAESSPYFEAFKKMNKEVLFVYSPIDDFVMTNVAEFNGRKVISAEHTKVDVDSDDGSASGKKLSKDEQQLFGAWLKLTLEDNVKEVKVRLRLMNVWRRVPGAESGEPRERQHHRAAAHGEHHAPCQRQEGDRRAAVSDQSVGSRSTRRGLEAKGCVLSSCRYYAYKHHRRANPAATSLNSKFIQSPAADIAKMLEVMGVDRVIAVDLQMRVEGHEACFFSSDIPVETIETIMAGVEYFATQVYLRRPLVVMAPNPECLRRARIFQTGLNKWLPDSPAQFAVFFHGTGKKESGEQSPADIVGDVKGADVIVVDDLIDTSETLSKLTNLALSKGARKVYCFASHPLLNGDAERLIEESNVSQVVVMDTIPADPKAFHTDKLKRLSVAPMLAELIQAEHFKAHSYIDKVNSREDFKYVHHY
ncbi:unnamed protein product [Phytophthora lilii]|uniref:Unnamed protein product n=1 Tax=Phytophthora lilii TaxID=2077276 RepID=A0A9W6WJ06_9STRA|nr:unnamed protein product [Phytophthora lilii]